MYSHKRDTISRSIAHGNAQGETGTRHEQGFLSDAARVIGDLDRNAWGEMSLRVGFDTTGLLHLSSLCAHLREEACPFTPRRVGTLVGIEVCAGCSQFPAPAADTPADIAWWGWTQGILGVHARLREISDLPGEVETGQVDLDAIGWALHLVRVCSERLDAEADGPYTTPPMQIVTSILSRHVETFRRELIRALASEEGNAGLGAALQHVAWQSLGGGEGALEDDLVILAAITPRTPAGKWNEVREVLTHTHLLTESATSLVLWGPRYLHHVLEGRGYGPTQMAACPERETARIAAALWNGDGSTSLLACVASAREAQAIAP